MLNYLELILFYLLYFHRTSLSVNMPEGQEITTYAHCKFGSIYWNNPRNTTLKLTFQYHPEIYETCIDMNPNYFKKLSIENSIGKQEDNNNFNLNKNHVKCFKDNTNNRLKITFYPITLLSPSHIFIQFHRQ